MRPGARVGRHLHDVPLRTESRSSTATALVKDAARAGHIEARPAEFHVFVKSQYALILEP